MRLFGRAIKKNAYDATDWNGVQRYGGSQDAIRDKLAALESATTPDDTAYDSTTWDGNALAATKNAIRDILESGVVLDPTPANQTANGQKISLVLGEEFTIMQIGYLKADGKLWLADANSSDTMPAMAMALAAGAAEATVTCLLIGVARNDDWNWTLGGEDGVLYVSATGGALVQTAPAVSGDQVQAAGVATHADRIFFNPALTLVEVA